MLFSSGQSQTINDVLRDKDQRVAFQRQLLQLYPKFSLVVIKLNIPGEIKYNSEINKLFTVGYKAFRSNLSKINSTVYDEYIWRRPVGVTAFLVIENSGYDLKQIAVDFEENYSLGRLFDVDVLTQKGSISRKDIDLPVRQCLLCNRPAKECARSRHHSVAELQKMIEKKWLDFQETKADLQDYREKIVNFAVKSLLYEVTVTPKPGLVDPSNHDSHPDMNAFMFIDSSLSLKNYFDACFDAGWSFESNAYQQLLTKIRPLGMAAEKKMFAATSGVNTHKGAIFSLGIIVTATANASQQRYFPTVDEVLTIVKAMCSQLVEKDFAKLTQKTAENLTAGQKQYLKYGLTGIRGEVQAGFPTIINWGLPYLKRTNSAAEELNQRLLNTLLQLAMHTADSNLIKRAHHNQKIIETTRQQISNYFSLGAQKTGKGRAAYRQTQEYFKQNNLSLGGTADLLIVTIFLAFLTNIF